MGQLETNCYVVTDEETLDCAVIDPGDESNAILDYLEENRLRCKAILLTHGHFDHVGAAEAVSEETGAPVYMNRLDDRDERHDPHFPFHLPDNGEYYGEGDSVELGSLRFEVLATPGHTPGSVCFRWEDKLFAGDTLFAGSCGRTDLPGGSHADMLRSLRRLAELEGDYTVYPGHGEATTLEEERNCNPYMQMAMEM